MALWLNSSQPVDVMETDISPMTANPVAGALANTVFHARADIRIESTSQDVPGEHGQAGSQRLVDQAVTAPSPTEAEKAAEARAAEMQAMWEDALARNMQLPDGYENVAVLIIKWDDGLDELKTRHEAEELRDVFRDTFNYKTKTVELNVSKKPQHQLSRYLSEFVFENDGPHNLLIVYYTGHGRYHEDERYLELCGSAETVQTRGLRIDARANWNKTEDYLASDDIDGDVLTILDTCYSSNHVKSAKEDTRTFELLSACAFDQTTARPGKYSYTRALIDALKELVQENVNNSFTTFRLNQHILLDKRRRDTPSLLYGRRRRDERHIRLAPLKSKEERERKPSFPIEPQGYLTLRFALRDEYLNEAQVEYLARNLSKAFGNKSLVGLRRIDYLGMKSAHVIPFTPTALAVFTVKRWRRIVRKRQEERRLQNRVDQVALPVDLEDYDGTSNIPASPLPRKRSRELENDEEVELPDSKKGSLVLPRARSDPPSPPKSESSEVDEAG